MGILSLLLWLPALSALVLSFFANHQHSAIRGLSCCVLTVELAITGWLLLQFDPLNPSAQFNEYLPLSPKFGSTYALGVDGLSLPMAVLTSALSLLAWLVSDSIKKHIKSYYICFLLLNFGVLGVFLAQDWAVFYICWETSLICLFFLLNRWGGKNRHQASLSFALYTMAGSIFMLISLIAVYEYVPEHSSLLSSMYYVSKYMPENLQIWALLGFLLGFGVQLPVFPMHGWLTQALEEAPIPAGILLAGVVLNMGAYGLLRVVPSFPEAVHSLQPLLMVLAFFGMLYGGLLAWRQTTLKAILAYSCISQMSVVLLGIASLNRIGLTGAFLQMAAHGILAAALWLLAGSLGEHAGLLRLPDYGSLMRLMPRFAGCAILLLFAAMGLPGSLNFAAQLHAFIGGYLQWGGLAMVCLSLSWLISAAYLLRTMLLLFTGPDTNRQIRVTDLNTKELLAAGLLSAIIIGFGFWPQLITALSQNALNKIHQQISAPF